MGANKTTTNNQTSATQQATASPTEQALIDAQSKAQQSLIPQQTAASGSALNLVNQGLQAFAGGAPASGPLGTLMGGIDQNTQDSIVQESLRQITPQFQQAGILNSGAAASIASRTAGDIYRQAAQFNVGNLGNVLNLLSGSNYQSQAPVNAQQQMLGGSLAGLRTNSFSGSGSAATYGQNPFVSSFQSGAGSMLGKPSFGPFAFFG